MTTALAVRGATKRFGAVLALESVDIEVIAGEVLAILGDNGAGKSTLIKCISGVHRLDAGTIEIDGKPATITSPAAARSYGIETVYQDLALFDNLDPAANFYAGPRGRGAELVAALRCACSAAGRWPPPLPRCSIVCRSPCPIRRRPSG